MNLLAEIRSRFERALQPLTASTAQYADMVRPAQDAKFGDFQANCAMPLAKEQKKNPREVAAEIVSRLAIDDLCETPEIAGPGFINLRVREAWLQDHVGRLVNDERFGVGKPASPRKIVVDYSSPNVAKPMHVGHLRSSVIGAALYEILKFAGHDVVSDNHVGDWGTQFGMIIYGYKHFVDADAYRRAPVSELARLYRLVNTLSDYHEAVAQRPHLQERLEQRTAELATAETTLDPHHKGEKKEIKPLRSAVEQARSDLAANGKTIEAIEKDPALKRLADVHPNIAVDARNETAKLHAGDDENRRLWDEFLPRCLDALQAVYERLGVRFDLALGESYYQPMLGDVVRDLESKQFARESQGATCMFLEGTEAPFIVRKSDGAYTYATTDLATVKYRVHELHADEVLYVVDDRQSDHFRMLFEAAKKWGYTTTKFQHVSFGTVLGADRRPFKTRAGDAVGLESLLDEAVTRARQIVDENDDAKAQPELDETERASVAEIVGIGGIKFADLHHNRESDYVFSWEKMLQKTGDTATYIQYSYARIAGIFRKGGIDRQQLRSTVGTLTLGSAAERAMAMQLCRFPETIDETARELRPHLLAQYLLQTANAFSTFYDQCPVLSEPDAKLRNSRLLFCDLTARVLELGLSLLGIRAAERM